MLRDYEPELKSVAARIAEAERLARQIVGSVEGREEKYTEVFRTQMERLLNDFQDGRMQWKVVTYTTDKQNGEEQAIGADLLIAVDLDFHGRRQQKGILVQAKVNKNRQYGVSVDGIGRLRSQCKDMLELSDESYVFAYGDPSTKVMRATSVATGAPLSKLYSKGIEEFFGEVLLCWAGAPKLAASSHRDLENLAGELRVRAGVRLAGSTSRKRVRKRIQSPAE